MSRERIIRQLKYGKRKARLNDDALPALKHTSKGFVCDEAYLEEHGLVEVGGKRREYNVLRVYLKEVPNGR